MGYRKLWCMRCRALYDHVKTLMRANTIFAIPQKSPQRALKKEGSHGKRFFCQNPDFQRSVHHENLSIVVPTVIGDVHLRTGNLPGLW